MSDETLTEAERYQLAASGDHGPETCDCDAYAPDNGYPDTLICEGLAHTFVVAAQIKAADRADARREALAPVLALADEWSTPESHRRDAWLRERDAADRLRAVASDPDTTQEDE